MNLESVEDLTSEQREEVLRRLVEIKKQGRKRQEVKGQVWEFEQSADMSLTAEDVLERLDSAELSVLKAKLTGKEKEKSPIPELDTAEAAIKRYLERQRDSLELKRLAERLFVLWGTVMHSRGFEKAFSADGSCRDIVAAFDAELGEMEESFRLYDLVLRYSGPIHSVADLESGKLDADMAAFEASEDHLKNVEMIEFMQSRRQEIRDRTKTHGIDGEKGAEPRRQPLHV